MSGFIAIYNTDNQPVQPRLLSSLVESLKFRGPDRQKIWIDGSIGLGHTLFRTTNEAKYENQPATLDRQVWITCSARIDDRKNLVNKLGMRKEINLSKTPDSELILHAYKKWGEDCLDHLLGDFAFVIWDNRDKKLFCARDRFGMRALYFAQKKNTLILCNSLHTVLQHPYVTKELNDTAIAGFLLFGDQMWMNDKSITTFKDILSLQPAHKFTFKQGKINIQRYWDIHNSSAIIRYKKESEYIEHFQEIFTESVRDRIRTPSVSITMSGGMDSTAIAATIQKIQKNNTHPNINIHAITAYYEQLFQCGEHHYASIVAEKLNIPIHFVSADAYTLLTPYHKITRPMEMLTPALWLDVKKQALSYSRVQLTGASADNLIRFSPAITTLKENNPFSVLSSMFKLKKIYGSVPSIGSGILNKLKWHKEDNTIYYPSWLNHEFEKNENLQGLWNDFYSNKPNKTNFRHPNAYRSLVDPIWNTDDIALNTETALPEERDPYLDIRLINFMFSLPSIPWFFHKHILRESMKGLLPEEVIKRPKTALSHLQSKLLKKPINSWVDKWEPTPKLSTYIELNNIPKVLNNINTLDDYSTYSNLRPLYLNSWLKQLD